MSDSLFYTFRKLKDNQRTCVYTEPLWGLSMNLCMPYLSVYMLGLGLSDTRIGFIVTVNTAFQILFAFLTGPITDKIGRRNATGIFDAIGWCIPALIWWRAENFWFFLAAAIFNGLNAVTNSSWTCLMIEDADKKQTTKIFSLVIACGQFSAFFAPITAILISRLTLVPAIRILFLNAFVLMSIKVFIVYFFTKETSIGKIRRQESKGKNIFQLAGGYGAVIKIILASKGMVFSIVIAALAGIILMINNTFWQIIVNKKLLVPETILPLFMVLRSFLAIIFLFFIIPRLLKGVLKVPLFLGFVAYLIGQCLLIMIPVDGLLIYPLLCLSLVFDGFGMGVLSMLSESLISLHVDPDERARIMSIRYMIIMMATAPFGWIAGFLSDISRNLPFVLSMIIIVIGIVITLIYYRKENDHSAEHD